MIPGEYLIDEGELALNEGREVIELTVSNTGDRPIQVGSLLRNKSRIEF